MTRALVPSASCTMNTDRLLTARVLDITSVRDEQRTPPSVPQEVRIRRFDCRRFRGPRLKSISERD